MESSFADAAEADPLTDVIQAENPAEHVVLTPVTGAVTDDTHDGHGIILLPAVVIHTAPLEPQELPVAAAAPTTPIMLPNAGHLPQGGPHIPDNAHMNDDHPQQAMVLPVQHHPPTVRNPGYFPAELIDRIHRLSLLEQPALSRFALSKLPRNATWGDRPATSKVLCVDNKPVTIYMVGAVQSTWFYTGRGEPVRRASIGIQPCTEEDTIAAQHLLGDHAGPPYEHSYQTIYARRHQIVRERGKNEGTAKAFDKVFDATTEGANLFPINAATIMVGDVVQVECRLTRWQKVGNEYNKHWEEWGTQLQLSRVDHIFARPENVDDGPGVAADGQEMALAAAALVN